MKKELILLACMTSTPYWLNSAGKWVDTAESLALNLNGTQNYPVPMNENFIYNLFDKPDPWDKPAEDVFVIDAYDRQDHSKCSFRLSRALPGRKQTELRSSIRANWILDTVASQYSDALVYMDKDNPELKAVIYTDDAGNMLMRLEQKGKYQEIRVKKIEFHTSAGISSTTDMLNKASKNGLVHDLIKSISFTEKGAGYVPV